MAPQVTITPEEYRVLMAQPTKRASKYRNKRTVYEGQPFHSLAELEFEMHLRYLRALGKVSWWIRQAPFYMPGGGATDRAERYLLDFLVAQSAEITPSKFPMFHHRLVDIKGHPSPQSLTKIAAVQALYGVKIELVKPKDVKDWI